MTADRFASLAELTAEHAGLVRKVGSELLAGGHPALVAAFVRRSVATGATLDAREDRAAAQEVVGFWTARMATAAREQARAARRSDAPPATEAATRPDFGDTLLAPYDPATLGDALAAADAKLATADPALVRRLLLRLVRLRPSDAKFDAAAASRASLSDLPGANADAVDRVVSDLAAAGVLRVTRGASDAEDVVALRPAVLDSGWRPLTEAQADRRKFRDRAAQYREPAARGGLRGRGRDALAALGRWLDAAAWKVKGWFGVRPEAERLAGDQQDDAEEYYDLNEAEVRFLRAGRCLQRKLTEANRGLVGVVAAAAGVAFILLGFAALSGREAKRAVDAEVLASRAKGEALKLAAEKEADRAARAQLSALRLLVRASSDVKAARSAGEQTVAIARWDALTSQVSLQGLPAFDFDGLLDEASKVHSVRNLPDVEAQKQAASTPRQLSDAINDIRIRLAHWPETQRALKDVRRVAFAMVETSIDNATRMLVSDLDYRKAEPYIREFWSQYWGEMLLVEGPAVTKAMIEYGQLLDDIRAVLRPTANSPTDRVRLKSLTEALVTARIKLASALAAESAGPLLGEASASPE